MKSHRSTIRPSCVTTAAPSAAEIPRPPASFIPPSMEPFRGYHPSKGELAAAPQAIDDLERFDDFAAFFGICAPDASVLIAWLRVALQWRQLRDASRRWIAYLRAEDAAAWEQALTLTRRLRPFFSRAAAIRPSLNVTCPGLSRFLDAPRLNYRLARRRATARP